MKNEIDNTIIDNTPQSGLSIVKNGNWPCSTCIAVDWSHSVDPCKTCRWSSQVEDKYAPANGRVKSLINTTSPSEKIISEYPINDCT